jgi:general secretion pathway protein N
VRNNYLFIGIGFAAFILFTLTSIPASVLTNQLPDTIRLSGVSGSLWNGAARSINITNWQLRDVHWDLNPVALLAGRLAANISAEVAGGEINSDASINLFGAISVSNLNAAGPIVPLATQMKIPVSGGRYQIELAALEIAADWPTSLIGFVKVIDVPLNIMGGGGGETGNYAVTFDAETVPEDGRLSGTLSDDGGPVEVGGVIKLTPPGNYEVQAKVKARQNAPKDIAQALTLIGPTGSDGKREFSMAGTF